MSSGRPSAQHRAADVAIVGGGIIGCGIAYELARQGRSVVLVERGSIGREASGASAGIVSPPSSPDTLPIKADLTAQSVRAYPEFIAGLEELTGADVGWRERGEINVARTDDEVRHLLHVADWQQALGVQSEWIDGDTLREIEPALENGLLGGILTRQAGSLDSYRLTYALASAAGAFGARIIEYTPALGVAFDGDRAVGVQIPDGVLPAGLVILASGAWTAEFGVQLGTPLPTFPSKGQMLSISDAPVMPYRIIGRIGGGHLVPQTDGSVFISATKERVDYDRRVTAANTRWLLDLVTEIAPAMLGGEINKMWTGFRSGSPDDQPIMGRVPGYRDLWVATGHYQTGIQMAVITAQLMASSITVGKLDPRLEYFSPARFTPGDG